MAQYDQYCHVLEEVQGFLDEHSTVQWKQDVDHSVISCIG